MSHQPRFTSADENRRGQHDAAYSIFIRAFTAPGSVIEWRWTHAIAGAWTSLEQQADGTSVVSLKIHSLSCPPVKMGQRSPCLL